MLTAMLAIICLAFLFQDLEDDQTVNRYHQHLSSSSEKDLGTDPFKDDTSTHLPIIEINTSGQKIPGSPVADENGHLAYYETAADGQSQIEVTYKVINKEGSWHHLSDEADQSGSALFRIRGNSSRWFAKKSYRLKMVNEFDENIKEGLLGMSEGNEWALYGPFLDKTLIRNYMCMNIAAQVVPVWTPDVRFCELYIDGEYQGLYVAMEMIDVDEKRVRLSEYEDGDMVVSYMVRVEPHTDPERQVENFSFYTYRLESQRSMEIIYPGRLLQNDYVKAYVQTDLDEVERKIYAYENGDGSHAWKDEIDLDSFVNYYIIEEFFGISDTFSASTYFYRDGRGKLHIGPVWDFNNAFDNFFQPIEEYGFVLAQRGWFGQMMRDKQFVQLVIDRYHELRKGVLSDEYLSNYVDETIDYLGSAIKHNYEIWGYSFDPYAVSARERRSYMEGSTIDLEKYNPENYEEAIEWMKDYMLDHAHWLDENIESLKQYAHPSKYNGQMIE